MPNEFKPNIGKKVSKRDVEVAIKKFDEKFRKNKRVDSKSVFFGRDVLLRLLSEEDSTGITFFFTYQPNASAEGSKEDIIQLAMVATKEDGTLMWDADGVSSKAIPTASSYDAGLTCPPYCPR